VRAFVQAALTVWAGSAAAAVEVREIHYAMGTILEIAVDAPDRVVGQQWIRRAVAEARRLDRELTSFDRASALSRLNAASGRGWQQVGEDLYRLLERAKALSRETGGSFDVTVGPLVALWADAARRDLWPSVQEIASRVARVGYGRIHLRPPRWVALDEGTVVELGGIGKGYAADRMAEVLRAEGAGRFLVNFGQSSLVAAGTPPWPVWIRGGGGLHGPVQLENRGLSTSGSLGKRLRVAGVEVGHVVDPRTGAPLAIDRVATVVAPTATEAEAWSKALLLEPDRTMAVLASREGYEARLFEGSDRSAGISGADVERRRRP
jgi:thiamine biosynthesis lipoprotein